MLIKSGEKYSSPYCAVDEIFHDVFADSWINLIDDALKFIFSSAVDFVLLAYSWGLYSLDLSG